MNEVNIMQLIETDPAEWTLERLRSSISEHETLLSRLRTSTADSELESLRSSVNRELVRQRRLLSDLRR